jgi:hypothetical protein
MLKAFRPGSRCFHMAVKVLTSHTKQGLDRFYVGCLGCATGKAAARVQGPLAAQGGPATTALALQLILVEAGELRPKPKVAWERFSGLHLMEFRHAALRAWTARSVDRDVLSGNRIKNGHGSLPHRIHGERSTLVPDRSDWGCGYQPLADACARAHEAG